MSSFDAAGGSATPDAAAKHKEVLHCETTTPPGSQDRCLPRQLATNSAAALHAPLPLRGTESPRRCVHILQRFASKRDIIAICAATVMAEEEGRRRRSQATRHAVPHLLRGGFHR